MKNRAARFRVAQQQKYSAKLQSHVLIMKQTVFTFPFSHRRSVVHARVYDKPQDLTKVEIMTFLRNKTQSNTVPFITYSLT